MTVNKQDTTKAIALVALLVLVLAFIAYTLSNATRGSSSSSTQPKSDVAKVDVSAMVKSEDDTDPMAYVATIEQYSTPPSGPVIDPFRGVLPKQAPGRATNTGGNTTAKPPSEFGNGSGLSPFNPNNNPGAQLADFPEIRVEGVLIDFSRPSSTYAVLEVGGKMMYLKAGDKLQKDLEVVRITEAGIWIQAAKERAFIEVSRAYKPTGLPDA
jgi:hypothetical protein